MATIGEMIVKLLADTSNFNASMDEAAAKVTASNDAMAASMSTSMQSFRNFDAITKESVKSTEGLAEAQAALQAVQQTGAFTSEELAAKQALVDAAMAKVGTETEAASGALSMFTRNSRTMYSTSALITDAMTGQFSRMRREVAALGNETGLMASVFRFAVSPAGLLVGAIAGLAAAAISADREFNRFENTVQLTNGYVGVTAGQLEAMAEKIGDTTNEYDDASTAVRELGASGQFTADQLQIAAQASVQFANLTGEKVSETDKLMVEMATHPQKALDELVDKYHRVTPAQADVIEGFLKQGDTAKAVQTLITDMAASVDGSVDEQAKHTSWLAKQWDEATHAVAEYFRTAGRNVNIATGGGDAAEKIIQLRQQLAEQVPGGATANMLQAQIDALQQIVDKENQAAAAAHQRAAAYRDMHPAQGSFAAFQSKGLDAIDPTGNVTKQLQTAEAAMKISYDKREEFESEYWGTVLQTAKAGTAQYIQAFEQVQSGQQRLDQQQLQESDEVARKQSENAKKAAEVAKRAAEERARAEERASQEIQQEIQKENALQLQNAEGEMQIAKKQIDIDRQALQDKYDAHQINAAQLLQGELKLDDELLASELQYLNRKKALDAGDVAAVAKDQQQITIVTLDAQQKRLQDLDHFHKQAEQKWKQYTQRVDGMVSSQVSAMLFQHQTLKNALANILESMTSDWIRNEVEQLTQTQATGAAKVAANIMSDQSTVVSHATAAAETKAISAATGKTEIGNAAASAAAKAFNAMAGIPIIGPVLGAIAAAATFVAVEAFGSNIASAEGGWERVPADGMLTELHRNEMVLPAHVADPVRKMAQSGGGGGNSYHFHSFDSRGIFDYARRRPSEFAAAMKFVGSRGHL